MNTRLLYTFIMALSTAVMITSCGDDPIEGCTDSNAANYNPDAEVSGDCTYRGCTDPDGDTFDAINNEDDGSCTFFDLYTGEYTGPFICEGALAALLPEAEMTVAKENSPGNTDKIKLLVSSDQTEFSLALDGTIDNEKITINTFLENFDIEIDLGIPIEGPFEISVTGELARNGEGKVKGPVSFIITQISSGASITDNCEYDATRS